jgi:hypothetical protein
MSKKKDRTKNSGLMVSIINKLLLLLVIENYSPGQVILQSLFEDR